MTRRFIFIALLLSSLSVCASAQTTQPASPPGGERGTRVFIAGHSFHVPMAPAFTDICKAAGLADAKTLGPQMIGGSSVTQHWNLSAEKNKARKALSGGEVDVLTLSPNLLMPDDAIDKFVALLLEHNPAGRVTIQQSWMPKDGRLIGAFANADRDKTNLADLQPAGQPWNDKLHEQVNALNARYAGKAKHPVVVIVPVGQAVVNLRQRVAAGTVPHITKQAELFRDDFGHGTEVIYTLVAYCHYAVIYGKNPVGLPAPAMLPKAKYGDDLDKLNRILQEIAWESVTTEPLSGVAPDAKAPRQAKAADVPAAQPATR